MKTILIALLVLALGAGGVFAADPLGDDSGTEQTIPLTLDPASSTTTTERGTTTTETAEDVPGPCDEPEHANDPRCTGGAADADDDRRGRNSGQGGGEDSGSGSGSGSGSSGRGGSDDDDRSGSNSGSG